MTSKIIPIPNNYIKDITGQSFGKITVQGYVGKSKNSKSEWLCSCSCGNERVILGGSLLSGRTISCGCFNLARIKTHGMYKSSDYTSYHAMIQRCYNKKDPNYMYYGGRGITVCSVWRDSFENFLLDMGTKPSREYSIEREKNNEGYSPENCVWATMETQSRNKRKFKNNTSNCPGVSWSTKDKRWCAEIGVGGKGVKLGQYREWWDAVCARKSAENRYWK